MNEIILKYIEEQILTSQSKVELAPEDDLLTSGLIDSMGMMKLIGFIENEFDFKVPPQDMTIENFMTVEAMSNYLSQRKPA